MKKVSLLLDDRKNLYQQLLAREAAAAADAQGITLLPPSFAGGSAWAQVESINACLHDASPPDGIVLLLAGGESARAPVERVLRAGVSLVLLNRLPDWLAELRQRYPNVLVTGVAPRQEGIGRVQAQQAARLVGPGATVVLVTGRASSVAAKERRAGFVAETNGRYSIQELDGDWTAEGAEKALSSWFQFAAGRSREPQLVVCQNDAMAAGARSALARQADQTGRVALSCVPLVGCDGLPEEGQTRVRRGELTATVVMPPTTPAALAALKRYWDDGTRPEFVLLEGESYPRLEQIRPPDA